MARIRPTLPWLEAMAEQRIADAMREGAFDDLPGAGRPLELEDDALVPEELRAAYRILKNAGFIPPELDAHSEVRSIEQLLKAAEDDGERRRLVARIHYLLGRGALRGERRSAALQSDYFDRVAEKLARSR